MRKDKTNHPPHDDHKNKERSGWLSRLCNTSFLSGLFSERSTQNTENPSSENTFIKYKGDPAFPSRNLFARFYHDENFLARKSLRDFFSALSREGIHDVEDFAQYTQKELFEIHKPNVFGRWALQGYINDGHLSCRSDKTQKPDNNPGSSPE